MVKPIRILATILFFMGAFSSVSAQTSVKQVSTDLSKPNFKFLDDISVDPVAEEKPADPVRVAVPSVKKDLLFAAAKSSSDVSIEAAGALQFKYSLLLDVEVELLKNMNLLRLIDDWYGTRYVYGGTTKRGIDCSALMQVFFASLYGIALPRTAKMQYDFSRTISRTELKEGDLLFFNTTGGVSHVGMYLTNNKFVHASSSNGVTVSDMFDPYYANRLIGVGRVLHESGSAQTTATPNP
ncbi:MAG TPA: C40 family peptidase [Flavisolibacter sp.]|jgi:lipoprotein Spr|nr:C40 family peptidase [Flavisolibacter sp.]